MAKAKKPKAKSPGAEAFFRPFAKIARTAPAAPAPTAPARAAAPPVPPPPRAPESPTAEADTFAIHMAGVQALDEDRATRIPRTASSLDRKKPAAPAPDADDDARARLRSLVAEGVRFETVDDGERIEGRRLDTDPRDLRRLRRAAFAIDGRLDLHGKTAADARAAVDAFVEQRARAGDVAVLIVHGKGSHSPRGHGILRGEIAAWLSQGRAARHVRAFATAPVEDGGGGAVVVLLAR